MKSQFLMLAIVFVALALVAPAVAQENDTAADSDNSTVYAGQVGNGVRVVSADLDGGQWHVVLEADYPVPVRVVDTFAGFREDGGSGNFDPDEGATRVNLVPGERTEVTVGATEYDGARGVKVIAPNQGWSRFTSAADDDPFQYFGGMSGLLTGMGIAVVGSGAAALYVTVGKDPLVKEAN